MKLLVFGHWSDTGFGIVTKHIGSRLVDLGLDVRVLALNHRGEPAKGSLAGRVWPLEYLAQHVKHVAATAINGTLWTTLDTEDEWKPDAVLAIADMSGLHNYVGTDQRAIEVWRTVPVYHYCPIEGDNLPPYWAEVWQTFLPVAMSDFGQRVMSEHIGRAVPRIYHGVDTEAFYPVSPGKPIRFEDATIREKAACKALFELDPARKLILRADRNVIRKNYDTMFRAFVDIARADPDVDLLLHCQPIDPEGIDLYQEIRRMPADLQGRVRFTGMHDTFKGLPTVGLNALYNAADLYWSTTGGEGFGLTLAESLAAGVPVVTTGWAAEIEVVGEGGIIVPPLQDEYGESVRYHSRYGMDWAVPDAKAFVEPILRLLSHPGQRKALGATGRLHVKRSFSWDTTAAEFLDLLLTPAEEAAA
jgi:glycosyltransferase involved in cell wall biosynthesis